MIPLWREFVDDHSVAGRPVRGIGEPVWPGRSEAELIECQHNESLLNAAFAGEPAWRLLCRVRLRGALTGGARGRPADASADREEVNGESLTYVSPAEGPGQVQGPLSEPSIAPDELAFGADTLTEARRLVYRQAMDAGLAPARTSSLVLAVNELATNSVRHAGGRGHDSRVARARRARVRGARRGRSRPRRRSGASRPEPLLLEGRGLWLVNQVCDLVQIRALEGGTVVRVRMDLAESQPPFV